MATSLRSEYSGVEAVLMKDLKRIFETGSVNHPFIVYKNGDTIYVYTVVETSQPFFKITPKDIRVNDRHTFIVPMLHELAKREGLKLIVTDKRLRGSPDNGETYPLSRIEWTNPPEIDDTDLVSESMLRSDVEMAQEGYVEYVEANSYTINMRPMSEWAVGGEEMPF